MRVYMRRFWIVVLHPFRCLGACAERQLLTLRIEQLEEDKEGLQRQLEKLAADLRHAREVELQTEKLRTEHLQQSLDIAGETIAGLRMMIQGITATHAGVVASNEGLKR